MDDEETGENGEENRRGGTRHGKRKGPQPLVIRRFPRLRSRGKIVLRRPLPQDAASTTGDTQASPSYISLVHRRPKGEKPHSNRPPAEIMSRGGEDDPPQRLKKKKIILDHAEETNQPEPQEETTPQTQRRPTEAPATTHHRTTARKEQENQPSPRPNSRGFIDLLKIPNDTPSHKPQPTTASRTTLPIIPSLTRTRNNPPVPITPRTSLPRTPAARTRNTPPDRLSHRRNTEPLRIHETAKPQAERQPSEPGVTNHRVKTRNFPPPAIYNAKSTAGRLGVLGRATTGAQLG